MVVVSFADMSSTRLSAVCGVECMSADRHAELPRFVPCEQAEEPAARARSSRINDNGTHVFMGSLRAALDVSYVSAAITQATERSGS
jgi:hypothetical protein